MGLLILTCLLIIAGAALYFVDSTKNQIQHQSGGRLSFSFRAWSNYLGTGLIALGLLTGAMTSFKVIAPDQVGHMKRIYFAADLPEGRIIGVGRQKGPNAEILGPGFNFRPFLRVLNNIEEKPIIQIPEGHYGLLVAKDGAPLRTTQFIADEWQVADPEQMLSAAYFLGEGKGQKGTQLNVLRPGEYRINHYLFDVVVEEALQVQTGEVAVVRSNVQTAETCPSSASLMRRNTDTENNMLSAPLVPRGCVGVWSEALPPQNYYLNSKAYDVTIIPTRVQTWNYSGGYDTRRIDLTVSDNGQITQKEIPISVPVPEGAADKAINVRVQGWTIPVDMRVVVQVSPAEAPQVVASVGDLQAVEDNIVTPAIRDILRTIGGQANRAVTDFIDKRDEIVRQVEASIIPEGEKAGVTIREARMGEPAIPPELLVASLREQLATQLSATYIQEEQAQSDRIEVEKRRAEADQQSVLVAAQLSEVAAESERNRARILGEGEKLRLQEIAQGQSDQVAVLGQDRVMQLQMLALVLEAARENPDIVKVPTVLVESGGGSSLEGAAAILGHSNLVQGFLTPATATEQKE